MQVLADQVSLQVQAKFGKLFQPKEKRKMEKTEKHFALCFKMKFLAFSSLCYGFALK